MPDDPTDEQIDEVLARINMLGMMALDNHPRRDRALEMLDQGGWLFTRSIGPGRFEFFVGWFEDPRMRPADADPQEIVSLMKVPRSALMRSVDADDQAA